jgi:hypothetical protein
MAKKNKNVARDIRDITYFIDHVKDIDFRISLIKELGYKIGVNVSIKDYGEKSVIIGKRNEVRIQIAPKEKFLPLAKCAIIE